MKQPFEIRLQTDPSYERRGLFAIELLDPIMLSRVSQGVTVKAEGLHGEPRVSAGGLFTWLDEDLTPLQKVSIDPGMLPYDQVELLPDELRLPPDADPPITSVELPPRVSYAFPAGTTGLLGMLLEERMARPARPVPIPRATVLLRWLEEDGVTWRDAPVKTRTDAKGSFAAFLRLAPTDAPLLDGNGAVTVRLRVWRDETKRDSAELKLPQGRIADPPTFAQGPEALILAWNELQP